MAMGKEEARAGGQRGRDWETMKKSVQKELKDWKGEAVIRMLQKEKALALDRKTQNFLYVPTDFSIQRVQKAAQGINLKTEGTLGKRLGQGQLQPLSPLQPPT